MLRLVLLVLAGTACWSARAPDAAHGQPEREKPARLAGDWQIAFSAKTQQLAVKVGDQYCGEVEFHASDVVLVSSTGVEQQVLPLIECEDFDDYGSSGPAHSPRKRAAMQRRRAGIDELLASGGFVPLGSEAVPGFVADRDRVRLVMNGKEVSSAPRRKDLDQHDREEVFVPAAARVPALAAIAVVIVPAQKPPSHYEYAKDRFEILLLRLPR